MADEVIDDQKDDKVVDKPVAETPEAKEEREDALRLYRALNGDKGVNVLTMLAREAGIKLADASISKEEKKDEIIEMLEESLGDSYKFLAPKLGPVLNKLLEKSNQKLEEKFSSITAKDLEKDTDMALDSVLKEHDDFKLFVPKIEALMKEISPTPGTSQKAFLLRLYRMAKAEAVEEGVTQKREERLSRSKNDISRVSPVGGSDKDNKKPPAHPRSLRSVIAEAMEDLQDNGND